MRSITQSNRGGRKRSVINERVGRLDELLEHLPRASSDDTDVVYIIQAVDGGPVKIGHSTLKGVAKRVNHLQIGNHHQLVIRGLFSGGMWLEHALHEYFHHSRLRGEWFSLSQDLVRLCPEIIAPDDLPKTRRAHFGYMNSGWTQAG